MIRGKIVQQEDQVVKAGGQESLYLNHDEAKKNNAVEKGDDLVKPSTAKYEYAFGSLPAA